MTSIVSIYTNDSTVQDGFIHLFVDKFNRLSQGKVQGQKLPIHPMRELFAVSLSRICIGLHENFIHEGIVRNIL